MPSGPNRDSGMKRNPSANHLFIVSARIAARCSASRLRRHGGSCVQRGGRLKRCESSARSCASVCSPDQLRAIFLPWQELEELRGKHWEGTGRWNHALEARRSPPLLVCHSPRGNKMRNGSWVCVCARKHFDRSFCSPYLHRLDVCAAPCPRPPVSPRAHLF